METRQRRFRTRRPQNCNRRYRTQRICDGRSALPGTNTRQNPLCAPYEDGQRAPHGNTDDSSEIQNHRKAGHSPPCTAHTHLPVTVPRVPARIAYDRIPAQFADVTERLVTQFALLQRAEVMCDRTTTRMKVAELQSALVDRGYEIKIDGIYGPETQGAMERFQHDNGLSNGYMTVETTRALGVDQ